MKRQTEKTRHTFLDKMDAIAYGVEARYELITGHSRKVTEETVDIARALRVPEGDIKRWVSSQLRRDTEKSRVIKSLLEKLEGRPLAPLEMKSAKSEIRMQDSSPRLR